MNDDKNDNKINIQEIWQDRRKRAGIKLLIYILFFIFLLLSAGISSHTNKTNINQPTTLTTTTTTISDKYSDKQIDLLTNKYNINYTIKENDNEYKINGTLNNNVVNGYLETTNEIKKIILRENSLIEIKEDKETILENDVNTDLISINYIINLIKQNSAIISDNGDTKTYTYHIDDKLIVISTTDVIINEIKIEQGTSLYLLNFDK